MQRKLKHDQLENVIPETMPVGYVMRRYPFKVGVSAVSKVNSRLPPAGQDDVLESVRFALVFLSRSALSNKKPRAAILFTVEEMNILDRCSGFAERNSI